MPVAITRWLPVVLIAAGAACLPAQPTWRLEPERVLVDSRVATEIVHVSDLAVSPAGRLFVSEMTSRALWLADPDGRRVSLVGGRGSGPGEFRSPPILGWDGPKLWAADPAGRRITFFSPAGSVDSIIQLDPARLTDGKRPIGFAGGSVYYQLTLPSAQRGGLPGNTIVVRGDPSGRITDTAASIGELALEKDAGPGGRIVVSPIQYRTVVDWAADGASYVVVEQRPPSRADSGVFVVTKRLSRDNSVVFRSEIGYPLVRITKAERDTMIVRSGTSSESDRRIMNALLDRTPYFPPVLTAFLARDGCVWVRSPMDDGRLHWTVVDQRGRPLAFVTTSRKTQLFEADGQTAWGVIYDGDDLPAVYRLRVRR